MVNRLVRVGYGLALAWVGFMLAAETWHWRQMDALEVGGVALLLLGPGLVVAAVAYVARGSAWPRA